MYPFPYLSDPHGEVFSPDTQGKHQGRDAGFLKVVHSLGSSSERSQVSTWERSHLSSSEQSELEGWDHGILPDVFVSSQTCLVNFIVCLGLCNNKR